MALRWGLEVSSFFHSEALKWVCEDHRQLRKHWSGWYENPKPDGRWGNQGSNKEALLTWWVHGWGGRGATTRAACLPPAERQCVAWLSLLCICCFPPWSGRGFQCDWISLISKLYTHLFQEAFFLMQHPERSGQWGCALAQRGYPGQWWIKQSAQAASTEGSTQVCASQPASILSASCSPSTSSAATPAPNVWYVRGSGGSLSSPVKMHKIEQREIHHCLPLLWFPLTRCTRHKRQCTNSLRLMTGKEWNQWPHPHVNVSWLFADGACFLISFQGIKCKNFKEVFAI